MRIKFVGGDSGGGNIQVMTGLTWPSVLAGDLAVIWWVMQNTSTPANPTGFTLDTTFDTVSLRARLEHKICTGSESGDIGLDVGTINRQSACLVVYRGTHRTSPILSGDYAIRSESTSGTTHANPAQILPVADCAVLTFVGERATNGTNNWTAPSGYTERADSLTLATGSGGTICAAADEGLATDRQSGVSVTPGVWTSANSFSSSTVSTVTLVIRPADYEGWGVPILA